MNINLYCWPSKITMPQRHPSPYRVAIVARYVPSGVVTLVFLYSSFVMATHGGALLSVFFLLCGAIPAFMFARRPSLLKLLAVLVFLFAAVWVISPYEVYERISNPPLL